MDDIHLSREILRAAADGRVPSAVVEEIKTEHLLSRCPHCRAEVVAFQAERRAEGRPVSRLVQILSALLGRLVALGSRELHRAEQDLRELILLPAVERIRRIDRARSRFRSPALVRRLLEESRRYASSQPAASFHLADLAERVANRNPGMAGYFDLYALAKAQKANACRVGDDRRRAQEQFSVGGSGPFRGGCGASGGGRGSLCRTEPSLRFVSEPAPAPAPVISPEVNGSAGGARSLRGSTR